jgi:hypothetical protein
MLQSIAETALRRAISRGAVGRTDTLMMPPIMQKLGLLVPHGWALDGYYAVLVRQGTTVVDIAPSLVALGAFALGFGVLGLWRFKFE